MEALELSLWICITLGLVSGVAAGFFGIGGGVIIVPCLLFLGFSMEQAIGVSIMQMIFSSSFGTLINIYKKELHISDGIFVGLGGLLGAASSGFIVSMLSGQILLICFLGLSLVSFYKFAFNVKTQANPTPPITEPMKQRLVMICAGMLTGIFAISLGVGGGLILAPILAYYLGFSSKKVVPISLFFIIFASISGGISLAAHDVLNVSTGLYVGLSSMLGVGLGIYFIGKSSLKFHRYALLSIYSLSILMSVWKIAQGFVG